MTTFRVREAADLLGVSDDTVRRWIDAGRLAVTTDSGGRSVVAGAELAAFAQSMAAAGDHPAPGPVRSESARNRFVGLVTRVVRDTVMAQVEIQAGPHRVVSLMSREAADELQLEPGVLAIAAVKSTNVVVERPARSCPLAPPSRPSGVPRARRSRSRPAAGRPRPRPRPSPPPAARRQP